MLNRLVALRGADTDHVLVWLLEMDALRQVRAA